MRIGVLAIKDAKGERIVRIVRPRTTIGRSSECAVELPDESVSRRHAEIEFSKDGFLLKDCNSRNGTRVNGVAVVFQALTDNDRIDFGNIESVFSVIEADENSIPPSAPCDQARVRKAARAGATSAMAIEDLWLGEQWDAAQAWRVVERFGAAGDNDVTAAIRGVVRDLAGLRDVKLAFAYLAPPLSGASPQWIKAGNNALTVSRCCLEEKVVEVAQRGHPFTLQGGQYRTGLNDDGAEAVCLPLCVAGKACACLGLVGDGLLPGAAIRMANASARGVGVGLSIWTQASGRSVPVGTARTNPVIVGRSKAIQQTFRVAQKAAATDTTVLIRGETGTGKELFARLIYAESARRSKTFLPVHCSAIEETLMGSVLFGHEKGAFTGAVGQKLGVFEEAHEGTIFLDEIGELSSAMQVKLLRVLQEGEFLRVGGTKPIRVDVRVIAATNRDLERAIGDGAFRQDLFYRLNVVSIAVPPLRERRADIPEMVRYFLADLGQEVGRPEMVIEPEAMACMERYEWPGNVRELRNVVERCLVLAEGNVVTMDDLPVEVIGVKVSGKRDGDAPSSRLDVMEDRCIREVLEQCGGNKRLAAQRLGISRSTLYEKLGT